MSWLRGGGLLTQALYSGLNLISIRSFHAILVRTGLHIIPIS